MRSGLGDCCILCPVHGGPEGPSVVTNVVRDRAGLPARRWLRALARLLVAVLWRGADGGETRWPAPGLWRPLRLLPWLTGLYGLIVVIATSGAVLNDRGGMPGGVAFLLLLPCVGGLALAGWRPLDGWRLVTLWLLVIPFLFSPPSGDVPPLEAWQWCLWVPVVLFAAWAAPGPIVAGLGIVVGLVLVALTWFTPWPVNAGGLPISVLGIGVPLVIGASLGARWDARRALAAEQARVAAVQAERGALTERTRIAREMHDVIAHHMSMIAVRCETAPYRLPEISGAARDELAEVANAARGALTEMQRLLGVLRTEDQPPERDPQPGIAALAELLAQARVAGADVSWDLDCAGLPDGLGVTVFRVVQQALANAGQHAAGAPVRVRVARDGPVLRLEVGNGPGRGAGIPGGGAGLRGMRERVELHGGRIDAGPAGDGGFMVRAELPLRDMEESG